ncbi:MgtC/SapB family protein [Aquibacillus halophilus]|uniref:MgtC/SapB family protein n=1 Tax=Aquibacillus halophilus TaxID=930132 RepID=A0A6A8DLX1_9BACI|nr:MgtC/SapB family protein [Aquibacillus halophilus]MRH44801.1 MgtC/SapB family protein [Aquibacillus halophilus]
MQLAMDYLFKSEFILMAIRIFIALLLSGLIGFERELKNQSAGFRTHILVGVSSCLMMLLSLYGFEDYIERYENVRFDPARIPSYVISGIGFLGAGTIIVNGMTIRGLTTAASIWAVAGIGLVVGAGMYGEAILTTVVILLSLMFLSNFERYFRKDRNKLSLQIVIGSKMSLENILKVFEDYSLKIDNLRIENAVDMDRSVLIVINSIKKSDKYQLYDQISRMDYVKQVNER